MHCASNASDRMISRMEVRRVIAEGEVIEDYPEEDQKMKCIHCQGEMKKGTVPFHVYRKGCHLVLDAVPAWICDQCGEAYFEEKEVDAIQELVRSMEQQAEALSLTA